MKYISLDAAIAAVAAQIELMPNEVKKVMTEDEIRAFAFELLRSACSGAVKQLKSIPTADVRPAEHGKWIDTQPHRPDWSSHKDGMAYYCSVCSHRAGKNKHKTYKFCPWCGAKMEG